MKKWNPETSRYEPFTPGERKYPPLPTGLAAAVQQIPTTHYGGLTHHPCAVVLGDGRQIDCVCLADAASYIKCWGVWPDQDSGKQEVQIRDVTRIVPSPSRLRQDLAQRLYDAGESGMGYIVFEVEYRDGSRSAHLSGGVIDFLTLQPGKKLDDIVSVHPHKGRESKLIEAPDFAWCLFEKE